MLIIVGRIRKAHGVRGDLVVEPITDDPDAVFAPGRHLVGGTAAGDPAKDRPELRIDSAQPFKGGYIVHFDGITDRNEADRWRDRYVLAPADELEPPRDDQIYLHQLPGMRVELASGEDVGTVLGTYELPQGLMLDVQRPHGTVMIPYDRIVVSVDREARTIRIDPPPGLLDD